MHRIFCFAPLRLPCMQTHHSHHQASVSTELAAFKMTPILPDCIAFEATTEEYQKQPSWLKASLAWLGLLFVSVGVESMTLDPVKHDVGRIMVMKGCVVKYGRAVLAQKP